MVIVCLFRGLRRVLFSGVVRMMGGVVYLWYVVGILFRVYRLVNFRGFFVSFFLYRWGD